MVAHSDLTMAFNVTHPISIIMYCYSKTAWESEVVSMADFNKVKWEENKCTLSKKCKVYYTRMGWPCNNKTAHLPFHFTAMQTYSFETETSEIACTLAGEVILSLNLSERNVWDLQQCRETVRNCKFLSSFDLFSYLCSVIQFSAWAARVVLKLHHVWTQRQEKPQSLVCLRLTFNYPLQHRKKHII